MLAGVFECDMPINAEITRAGLGVPMVNDSNCRFYDEAMEAVFEVESASVGFFDLEVGCTSQLRRRRLQLPKAQRMFRKRSRKLLNRTTGSTC